MALDRYRTANREMWDRWAELHRDSAFYDVEGVKSGTRTLDPIARAAFGDVRGRRLLHLQCHFGLDTLMWAQAGAEVTGVDFSPEAIVRAQDLADEMELPARFIESDLYALPEALAEPASFDCVFASHGALPWLPDIAGWARVASHFLAEGGELFVFEGHPLLFTLDDERDDEEVVVRFPYFQRDEPTRYEGHGTYAVPEDRSHYVHYEWNHGLAETLTAVLDAGLELVSIEEHPFVFWQALPWMAARPDGFYEMPEGRHGVPLSFTLKARKPDLRGGNR